MALSTATITFDIADQLGNDFDPRRTKVWVTTNTDTVIDTAGDKIRLGSGNVTLNADGTGSIVVWVPGAGSNPDSWQTTVHVDYPDRNADRGRRTKSFGPFTVTADANLADLVAEMPVQPEYASDVLDRLDALEAGAGDSEALDELTAQVNGYTNLGNVSGAQTITPVGTQRLVATGPTTISIASGHSDGESFTLLIRGGGEHISWHSSIGFDHGQPEGDKISVTFMRVDGFWTDLSGATSGGGEEIPPVTDPPTQPGTITVDPTADGYNLTWVASTVASGYEVQIDAGSWVDSGADLAHSFTGLIGGSSHSGAVRAYNSEGERSTSRAWGPASVDTPTVHDLLMSLEPEIYLRMTNGSLEDFSRVTGAWSTTSGSVAFNGPPLTPGDASSANFGAAATVQRSASGLLVGGTKYTAVFITGIPLSAAAASSGSGLTFGSALIHGDTWSASGKHQKGGIHTWFSMLSAADFPDFPTLEHRFFEAETTVQQRFSWANTPPFTNTNPLSFTADYYHSHIAIFKDEVLDVATREAICLAAGTLDNAANGGL